MKTNYIFKARWLQGAASANESKKMQVNPRIVSIRFACTLLLFLTLGVGNAWATTANFIWDATGRSITTISGTIGQIDLTTSQNSCANAPAVTSNKLYLKYASTGDGASVTVTAKSGYQITGVTIYSSTNPTIAYKVGNGDYSSKAWGAQTGPSAAYTATVTGLTASSVTFQNQNTTSTDLRIHSMIVVYKATDARSYGNYKLVESSGDIGAGEYLIVYNNTYAFNTHYGSMNTNTYATYTDISSYYDSKIITSNSTTDALSLVVAATTNGYSIYKEIEGAYLGCTSTTNVRLHWDNTFTTSNNEWTLDVGSIVSVNQSTMGIRWNNTSGSYRFTTYGVSNQSPIQLFKRLPIYNITWVVDGKETTAGSPTSIVEKGSKVTTLPTNPSAPSSCSSKVFVGWTTSEIDGSTDTPPSVLFTTAAGAPAVNDDVTYYAVFADEDEGSVSKTYEFTISYTDFNTTSYSANDGNHSSTATATDASGATMSINWASSNVMRGTGGNSSKMQFRSTPGYLYNTTDLGAINSVSVTSGSDVVTYQNSTSNPTSNGTPKQYFRVGRSSGTGYAGSITVNFTKTVTSTTYSAYVTSCTASHTLSSAVVPAGKATVTLGATSVAEGATTSAEYSNVVDGYEFGSWSISGTGATLTSTSTNPTTVTMGTADATVTANLNRPIYLELCSDWKAASAKYAVYYWKGEDNGWSDFMTAADCSSDNLTTTIPGWATHVIFVRFNPSKLTTGNWDDKYNQTSNVELDATATNNYYYNVSGKDDSYSGSWKAYTPSYTVSFDKNTSANGVTDPDDQCVLASSGRATAPTISDMSYGRLGYQLAGWKDGETTWNFSSMGFTSNKTLTADWTEGATTTVALNPTWSGTGNTWDKDNAIIFAHFYIDGTTQAQDVQMTKNVCDGIFTAEAPYGATHVSFARCKSGTSSLGAVWNDDSNIYNYVTGQAMAANYQYSITGWGSGKVGTAQKESSAYTPSTLTITFAGNSNTGGTMDDISSIACDADQALPTNTFTRTGYNFTGWNANVDVTINSATVTAGTLIEGTPTIQNIRSNITLTAQWEIVVTTVTLNKNGATTGSNQTVSATYGSAMPTTTTADVALTAPSKNGYTLLGFWDTSETTGGTQYYDANMSSVTTWDKETATATLYARWSINTDQFIDDMHNTTGYTSGSPHEESGADYTMPGPLSDTADGNDCETDHYKFVGWVDSGGQNADGTLKESGSRIYRAGETKHATNATYYAVWAEE